MRNTPIPASAKREMIWYARNTLSCFTTYVVGRLSGAGGVFHLYGLLTLCFFLQMLIIQLICDLKLCWMIGGVVTAVEEPAIKRYCRLSVLDDKGGEATVYLRRLKRWPKPRDSCWFYCFRIPGRRGRTPVYYARFTAPRW